MLPEQEQQQWLSSLSDAETQALETHWPFWARPSQLPPTWDWRVWLICAGRGYGKTRVGAEWVRESVKTSEFVNVIAPTADDARDICIEGESGILAVCSRDERPAYRAAYRRLEWPNGAKTLIFTADEPERLRGKQHQKLWGDEIAAWRYADEAWTQASLGLRLGNRPQAVLTTTPKPLEIIRRLISDSSVAVTRGSTYDNRSNLAPAFFQQIIRRYEGTRIGRQELMAEILEDVEGAMWENAWIDNHRTETHPDLVRIGVGVDPSGGSGEGNDEQGIIVAGLGTDGHGYVLADYSCKLSPDGWGRRAVQAFVDYQADVIFVEKNYGGEMAIANIATAARALNITVPVTAVTASRGKIVRAEPVAALYQQGRVHHCGKFEQLENQMVNYVPGWTTVSPDRMDALVWVATEILLMAPVGVWEL